MRHLTSAVVLLVLFLLPLHALAYVEGFARINLIQGDVQLRVADTDEWVPAAVNTPLYEGDSIWCPAESRVEIQLQDGSYLRLDARSSLDILEVADDSLQFHLGMGHAYVRTGDMRKWSMQFDMTESTVKVYDKARFRLDITADGDEDVSVFKGVAYVESYGSKTRVRTGEMLSVEDNRSEIATLNPPDKWEKWNVARDRKAAGRKGGGGRLPEELVIYEEELDTAGEWVDVPEYGYVWLPTVVVSVDWAPYRLGRWFWRGGDYVWISFEPWGWVPYHYGRWVIIAGRGWCWVPPARGDVYWGPGYVGWISSPSYVGWVPLAPGEIFYGRRYYGRASVQVTNITNITNVNIDQTRVSYKNVTVNRNSMTVVQRDSFVKGKYTHVKPRENVFARDKAVIGRPEPKPADREVRMPRVRNIPAARLPPPAVANVPVRELKQRHPKVFTDEERRGRRDERREPARPEVGRDRERRGQPGRETPGAGRHEIEPRPHPPQPVVQPKPEQPGQQKVIIDRGREKRPAPDAGRRETEPRPQSPQPVVQPQPAQPERRSRELERRDIQQKEKPAAQRPARKVWNIKPREDIRPEKEKQELPEKKEKRRD